MRKLFHYSLLIGLVCALLGFAPKLSLSQSPAEINKQEISKYAALDEAYAAEDWQKALALAREYLMESPDNPDLWQKLGLTLAETEAWLEAEEAFQKSLSLKPDDPKALRILALTQVKLEHSSAVDTLKKAIVANPNDDVLLFHLGKLYDAQNKIEEAAKAYESAYELKLDNLEYLTAATRIYFDRGEHEKATALTQKALEHNPGNGILISNHIVGLYRSGRYAEVVEAVEKESQHSKDDILLIHQARALIALNRYSEAEALMRANVEQAARGAQDLQRLELARAIWANSCTTQAHKTCNHKDEDACCLREREAHQTLKKINHQPVLEKDEYKLTMGLSSALNNELEDAEAILRAASHGQMASTNANALAALAVTLYLYSDAKDKAASLRLYREAVDASADFAALDKLQKQRHWPERAVDILKNIQAEIDGKDKAKQASCACRSTLAKNTTSPALAAFLLATLLILGLALRRRKA